MSLYRAPLVFDLQHAYGFDDPLKWHNGAMNSAPYVAHKLVLLEASECFPSNMHCVQFIIMRQWIFDDDNNIFLLILTDDRVFVCFDCFVFFCAQNNALKKTEKKEFEKNEQ